MLQTKKTKLFTSVLFLFLFMIWTAAVFLVDRQPIGPEGTRVGFAALNVYVHRATGVHMFLYELTDILSFFPVAVMLLNAAAGLLQWIRRRSIRRVDKTVICAGILYALLLAVYIFFEVIPVNFRPVLIAGITEASYPSSTTMLVMTVMLCGILQLHSVLHKSAAKHIAVGIMVVFTSFTVMARIISGVHWITDIIGGILIALSLTAWYAYMIDKRAR